MNGKICDSCKTWKPDTEFKKLRINGMVVCHVCRAVINAERLAKRQHKKEHETKVKEEATNVTKIRTDRVIPRMDRIHPYLILYARKSLKSIKQYFDSQ